LHETSRSFVQHCHRRRFALQLNRRVERPLSVDATGCSWPIEERKFRSHVTRAPLFSLAIVTAGITIETSTPYATAATSQSNNSATNHNHPLPSIGI
jgi:hypothetical protein